MDAAKAMKAHHLLLSSNTPGLEQAGAGTLQEPGGFPWCAVPSRIIIGAVIPPPATAHAQHPHPTWLAKCSRAMLPTKPSRFPLGIRYCHTGMWLLAPFLAFAPTAPILLPVPSTSEMISANLSSPRKAFPAINLPL